MPVYNPYLNSYQPYGNYFVNPYQQMPQPVQQQPQMAPPVQTSNSMIWVLNRREADSYPVAPNTAVTLWNQSEPVVYLKQADPSGRISMKEYDLVERTTSAQNESTGEGAKSPAYATKDELTAVVGAINGINGIISSVKSDIDTIKGDMYGIAGKKKPVKKQEDDDNG